MRPAGLPAEGFQGSSMLRCAPRGGDPSLPRGTAAGSEGLSRLLSALPARAPQENRLDASGSSKPPGRSATEPRCVWFGFVSFCFALCRSRLGRRGPASGTAAVPRRGREIRTGASPGRGAGGGEEAARHPPARSPGPALFCYFGYFPRFPRPAPRLAPASC